MDLPTRDPGTKVCPQCAEEVKAAARICRFCDYQFDVGASSDAIQPAGDPNRRTAGPGSQPVAVSQPQVSHLGVLGGLLVVVVVIVIAAGAIVWSQQSQTPTLSEAASYWCGQSDNFGLLHNAGQALGVGDDTLVLGQNNGAYPWPKPSEQQRADYVRVCNAAFGSR